jgi:plasmid maintenance system antidote protein VapI
MINPIARRIAIFLEDNAISIKDFAEKLQVQRSSLSHILSGRNKPSLDFILKMLRAYPSLSERWLLHGKGFPLATDTPAGPIGIDPRAVEENPHVTNVTDFVLETIVTGVTDNAGGLTEEELSENQEVSSRPRLVKVLLLYSDGSFRQYHSLPADQEE